MSKDELKKTIAKIMRAKFDFQEKLDNEIKNLIEISNKIEIMRMEFYMDGIYRVLDNEGVELFKGTITECDSYIRLKSEGYL